MGSAVGWELGIEGMETFANVHQGIEIGFVGAVGGHCVGNGTIVKRERVCCCVCRCGGEEVENDGLATIQWRRDKSIGICMI